MPLHPLGVSVDRQNQLLLKVRNLKENFVDEEVKCIQAIIISIFAREEIFVWLFDKS